MRRAALTTMMTRAALAAMTTRAALAATITLAAVAWPASGLADDRPPSMPLHDARVLYRVAPQSRPVQQVRVSFGGHGRLVRIDGPPGQGATILDRDHGLITVVVEAAHAFMVIPTRGPIADPFLLDPAMAYSRTGGRRTIAGLACDEWTVASVKGHAVACVTGDGLLLSADGVDGAGAHGEVLALEVSTAALPASAFAPPPNYQRIEHPASSP